MGNTLTGLTPATTYDALIKVGDNEPLTASLKVLSDGVGTNLPMEASTTAINFTGTLTQAGTTLQPTLVSGTNIKTINSTSILGSGNIAVVTSPSGVAGAIQFSNGSAFASDASNLFWDDTNNRLGVGTNAPTTALQIDYASSTLNGILINQTGGTGFFSNIGFANNGAIRSTFGMNLNSGEGRWFNAAGGYFATIYGNGVEAMRIDTTQNVNIGATSLGARLGIKGSGSTSATTSLLVQNSAGTERFKIQDNGLTTFNGNLSISSGGGQINASTSALYLGTDAQRSVITYSNNNSVMAAKWSTTSIGVAITDSASGLLDIALNTTAVLQAESTTRGFLPPRMTTTQRNAIASPATGLVVMDITTFKLCVYNGTSWVDLH